MLPVNLLNALKEYSVAAQKLPLPAAAADAVAKTGLQFELGQKVQGSVQAHVTANIFKVSVSGQLVQLELPSSIRSGDTVALQVIALQPRLTFSMVSSDNPLSTPEQLGATARMLSSLSQQTPEKAHVRAAQSSPIWETPQPPETEQLAGMLKEALSNSGLFYESHQAQWLGGNRSTTQLMLEPQNMTPEQVKAVTRNTTANKSTLANESTGKIIEESNTTSKTITAGDSASKAAQPENAIRTENIVHKNIMAYEKANSEINTRNSVSTNPANQPNTSSPQESKTLGIPDHLQPLVQQQLNALETNQMMWQGNIWPGQEMQWEVHEQGTRNPAEEDQRQWVTQIQLDLPNLGEVSATLRFNNAGLSLTLNADTSKTRTVLGNASTRLVSALADAGIPILSTTVTQ